MICEKTGAHIFLEEYGEYVYGDMHRQGSVLIMRACQVEFDPILPRLHYTVHRVGHFWRDEPHGTIVIVSATSYGYEGTEIEVDA